jgi:hypothetical protein
MKGFDDDFQCFWGGFKQDDKMIGGLLNQIKVSSSS